MTRSMKIDVFLPKEKEEFYKRIISSIRLYRSVCRQLFCAGTMAEIATATIERGSKKDADAIIAKPGKTADDLMSETLGGKTSNKFYGGREWVLRELAPTWLSFVWDAVRRDIDSRWKAPDPEFTKAKRGYLVMQGARGLAMFQHIGIGMPQTTARPKLHEHKITVKWDHEIGEVDFVIKNIDGGRYWNWKNIRDKTEGWSAGTIYLNERDGKLFFIISFDMPDKKEELVSDRTMIVEFNGEDRENFITMHSEEKRFSGDKISAEEAVCWLSGLNARREALEHRRAAAGNPRRVWGDAKIFKGVQKIIDTVTATRDNGCKTRNHLWTRRITECARRNKCGSVVVVNTPEREMFGHPWGWHQFETFLKYKIEEIGGKINFTTIEEKKVA